MICYVIPYYVVVPARVLVIRSDPPKYSEPSKVKEVEETTFLVPIEMMLQVDSAQIWPKRNDLYNELNKILK